MPSSISLICNISLSGAYDGKLDSELSQLCLVFISLFDGDGEASVYGIRLPAPVVLLFLQLVHFEWLMILVNELPFAVAQRLVPYCVHEVLELASAAQFLWPPIAF